MSSKIWDVVERTAWTLLQAGGGLATVTSLGLPVWVAAPVAGALAVIKNVLVKTAPVVEVAARDVAEVAPVLSGVLPAPAGRVVDEVGRVAGQIDTVATAVAGHLSAG